jgi:methylamine dehydrogenase accessory protein MauD
MMAWTPGRRYDHDVGSFAIGVQVLLAAVFATAGAAKLLDQPGSRRALIGFGVPRALAPAAGVLLPLSEIGAAVALAARPSARWGAVAALFLVLSFVAGISRALKKGRAPDCHCFGQLHSAPAGPGTLIRNAVLAALAIVLVIHGPGPAIDTWIQARSPAELVAVGLGITSAVLAVASSRLWAARRELRREITRLQRATAALPPGLPVGTPAPEFDLANLSGEKVKLAELRARGLPVLLTFVRPSCASCELLFPDLARWQRTLADRITIVVISSGSPRDNRPAADEHGLVNVLLDRDDEITAAYRVRATPTAVLVTAAGEVGSEPAVSDPSIAPLIRVALRDATPRLKQQLAVIPPRSTREPAVGVPTRSG